MTRFVDTWLCCADEGLLRQVCEGYVNCLGPVAGRAAVAASVDAYGNEVAAQEAVGDPDLFYVCVRDETAVVPPNGVAVCAQDIGEAVLGVWA